MLVPLWLDLGAVPVQPSLSPAAQLVPATTGSDLIYGALRNISAIAAGETLGANELSDALGVLNDLLDSLSSDKDFIYVTTENILAWNPNQYKYTIGNPIGGTFIGSVGQGSNIITNMTVLPSNLIVGGTLTDVQSAIAANTTVTAIGANTVTMSNAGLATVTLPETITFTTPGNFAIQRPLRISSGYTRITAPSTGIGLDYWFDCQNSMDRYNELGYKGVPGPWPTQLAYQPTFPLGTIWVYPNPTVAGEVHLFTDLILTQFASTSQQVVLPQGYTRALKKLLALELCPEYGKNPSRELMRQAMEARAFIKALNASPVVTLRYDTEIVRSQTNDAGWIIHGGFY
jgi:hypothetical protein